MPKLINSVAYELGLAKEKNKDLQRRIQKLDDEVLQLKTYIRKNNLPLPKAKQPITSQPTIEKGFLKTTKASRNRSIQAPTQEKSACTESVVVYDNGKYTEYPYTEYRHGYRYVDGNLVKIDSTWDRPHYLKWTISSDYKNKGPGPWIRALWERERKAKEEKDSLGWGNEEDSGYEEPSEYSSVDEEELESHKSAHELLREKSEVNRKSPSHLRYVPIRSECVYDILKRSLRLAQEIFFHGIQKCFPCCADKLDGPQEVLFGRVEINRFFGGWDGWKKLEILGRSYDVRYLKYETEGVTVLRNTVCHYSHYEASMNLEHHDSLIEAVQLLAIFFADERRAFQARALRDKLIAHAEQCLRQLEDMLILAELPGARPWQPHQARGFKRIILSSDFENDDKSVPFAVLRAAQDWNLRRPTPVRKWLPPEEIADQFI
ncbi:hypothetical protein F4813DRAFT_398096 [Daldinia decipiens]|uniref:uncharacterized protein n=1 Tax=Daldinia decipiens TaxID=326647 RepID=UPI0020C37E82|nr:uncharacterized protein F4813DRAFT_398096 [Daldinia decipiens]KAI1655467.1 hypothetical protein F4813DRAFT_398096 [Daldinia decipiens]